MCRRGMSGGGGKRHFACFRCRKSFKAPGTREFGKLPKERSFTCPDCGSAMADMGADFRAPRRRDRRQWTKVEVLHAYGYLFRPRCCKGPGRRPRSYGELLEFLRTNGFDHDEVAPRLRLIARSQARS